MKPNARTFPAFLLLCVSAALVPPSPRAGAVPAPAHAHPAAYRFVGGRWFDGRAFVPKTVYSVNGVLRTSHAGRVDETFDLGGRYVVPPFAEAHNHHFQEGMDYRAQVLEHLARGIFYAKNTNSIPKLTDPVRPHLNSPESVDVLFSGGGLTAPGGHPAQIYDYLAGRNLLPGLTRADVNGQAYFAIGSGKDLEAVWPAVKAGRPDFIKAYLEHSEEYEARKDDPKFYGRRGLSPALLREVVRKAHGDGLRVAVHVNTAADFRNALLAGADEIAHLPLERINAGDARRAAAGSVVVVTTTLSHRPTGHVKDPDEVHRHNLRLLHAAGARLAVGTDDNNRTAVEEAENLNRLGVFDRLTLLKLWVEDTPQAIFPARKIGALSDGYEASFITLDGNPLDDFANVRRVRFRFKQGHPIRATDPGAGKPPAPK
ncbi:MAG TPA: amidohydrolase family protein [Pyrinomonadaceae bacterium]|nr:amidohydrolase family protein [Pyrinomonadaceae bacterium]